MPKVTQLVIAGAGIWFQVIWLQSPKSYSFYILLHDLNKLKMFFQFPNVYAIPSQKRIILLYHCMKEAGYVPELSRRQCVVSLVTIHAKPLAHAWPQPVLNQGWLPLRVSWKGGAMRVYPSVVSRLSRGHEKWPQSPW